MEITVPLDKNSASSTMTPSRVSFGANRMHHYIWTGLVLVVLAIILGFVPLVPGIITYVLHAVGVIMIVVGIVMMLMGKKR